MLTPNRKDDNKQGECEVCDKTDVSLTRHYGNMWFCDDCWSKEQAIQKEHQSPENQQKRVDAYRASVQTSRELDNKLELRTDLFNAATTAIIDLKKLVDDDTTIENKPYALASELLNRFNHFKEIIFKANEAIVEANNNQKAIQVYLNQMANTLRAEEREKLKLSDISYKPQPVKTVKPAGIKTSGLKKVNKEAVRALATELGVSEFTVQMVVVQMGGDVEKAGNHLRRSINEAKSMQ